MKLKDVLKNFRAENKISQRELARRCDLSNSLISLLEMDVNPQTGKKMSPDLETYRKLASGMGISAQTLFEMLDETELVSLSYSDFERAIDLEGDPQIRIVSGMMENMSEEQKEQIVAIVRAVVAHQPHE